jgi:hypothetical protein
MTTSEISNVLQLIRPGCQWNVRGETIEWLPSNTQVQPTDQEMADGYVQLQSLSYRGQRAAEYPSIGDQLDALWKGGQPAADMLAQVQAVKAKYPKPS